MGCNACETQWSEVIQFGRLMRDVLKADKSRISMVVRGAMWWQIGRASGNASGELGLSR